MELEIKTYREGLQLPTKRTYYAQSRGLHSGRPLREPIANCYAIIAGSEEQKEQLYQLNRALFKVLAFRPYLLGTCVLLLRIGDYRSVLEEAVCLVGLGNEQLCKTLQIVSAIDQIRAMRAKQDQYLDELERTTIGHLFTERGNEQVLQTVVPILQQFISTQ